MADHSETLLRYLHRDEISQIAKLWAEFRLSPEDCDETSDGLLKMIRGNDPHLAKEALEILLYTGLNLVPVVHKKLLTIIGELFPDERLARLSQQERLRLEQGNKMSKDIRFLELILKAALRKGYPEGNLFAARVREKFVGTPLISLLNRWNVPPE